MAKKFTLSVPDGLAQKIEARRDYLGNLSALFQKAVEEQIFKKEQFDQRLGGDESLEAIIDRLGRERREIEGNLRGQGRQAGMAWAKAASYVELKRATGFSPGVINKYDDKGIKDDYEFEIVLDTGQTPGGLRRHYKAATVDDELLRGYFQELLRTNPPVSPPAEGARPLEYFPFSWMKGWCEAVREFWAAVKEKL